MQIRNINLKTCVTTSKDAKVRLNWRIYLRSKPSYASVDVKPVPIFKRATHDKAQGDIKIQHAHCDIAHAMRVSRETAIQIARYVLLMITIFWSQQIYVIQHVQRVTLQTMLMAPDLLTRVLGLFLN